MATYILVECECGKCGKVYQNLIDKKAPEDAVPPCTFCHPEKWTPMPFAITTNKSRALNIAQKIAEEQYGLTDMKDNLRPGDTAIKLTPEQSRMADEAKLMTQAVNDPLSLTTTQKHMAEKFWGGQGNQNNPLKLPNANTLLAGARAGAQAAKAEGLNPLTMLHTSLKQQRKARGAA